MKIALCMLAWNESDVIGRAIKSALPLVDGVFVVLDTRTTDKTEEAILASVADKECVIEPFIPKEVSNAPDYIFDFALCRNRAFELAKERGYDIGVILDADEVLEYKDLDKSKLVHDGYIVDVEYHGSIFDSVRLVNFRKPWEYKDKIHNWLSCPGLESQPKTNMIKVIHHHDGYRSRLPNKVSNDVKILKSCVEEAPDNSRYWFYYAQTLRENGQYDESIEAYKRRIDLKGWDEEIWYSTYMIGNIYIAKNEYDNAQTWLLKAYQQRPTRREPLYHLAVYARNKGYRQLSYMYCAAMIQIPKANDGLFMEADIYTYMGLFEYGIATYWVGRYKESYDANEKVLNSDAPEHIKRQTIENQKFNYSKLGIKETEEKDSIGLIDISFKHVLDKYGFDSATDGVNQNYLNYKRDDYGHDGTVIVTDFMITDDVINKLKSNDVRLWLLEPKSRIEEIYYKAESLAKLDKVTGIYTYDDDLLDKNKTYLALAGGSWVDGLRDGLPNIPQKSKMISFVCGRKNDNKYHQFRINCRESLQDHVNVDIYGWDKYAELNEYLDDYLFSIVVENDVQDNYFTEKIINCFRKGVIPIYFGALDIDRYFNGAGIIKFVDETHLKDLVSQLHPDDYRIRRDAIRENYLLAERYISRDGNLARVFNGIHWNNPFDYFDQIYIITLYDVEERFHNATELSKQIGVEHCQIFKAIRHEKGGLGCRLSHRACIQDAYNNGYEKIMIFEDDAFLLPNYKYYMTEALNVLSTIEWEHLKFHGTQKAPTEPITTYLHRMKAGYTTSACAFHSSIYQYILTNISDDINQGFTQYVDSIDKWISDNVISRGKSFLVPKMTVKVKNYKSIIEGLHDIDINQMMINSYHNFCPTKHIYFNEGIETFGRNYMKHFGFIKVNLRYADVPGLLWFGIYTEDELKRIIGCVHNINLHWCGSDTLIVQQYPELMKLLSEKENINHTCENDLHHRELKEFGITARVAPMVSEKIGLFEYYNGVKKYDVMVYTPSRHELYNVPLMIDIARDNPDINFVFIGDQGALKSLPGNVTNLGWIPQEEVNNVIQKSKIYLRITQHDGFADLTIKSLLQGTHVITNYDFPYVHNKNNKKDIEDTIKSLLKNTCDPKISEFYKESDYINNWDLILKYHYND